VFQDGVSMMAWKDKWKCIGSVVMRLFGWRLCLVVEWNHLPTRGRRYVHLWPG